MHKKAYDDLSESEQVGVATRVNDACVKLIREVVDLVASQGVQHLDATFAEYKAGPKGIRIVLSAPSTEATREAASGLVGADIVIVGASLIGLMGERQPILVKRDQPALFGGPDMEAIYQHIEASNGLDVTTAGAAAYDGVSGIPKGRGRRKTS